jgi:hypothetical protein
MRAFWNSWCPLTAGGIGEGNFQHERIPLFECDVGHQPVGVQSDINRSEFGSFANSGFCLLTYAFALPKGLAKSPVALVCTIVRNRLASTCISSWVSGGSADG